MAALPALGTLAFAPGAAASVPPLDLSLDEIIKMNKKQGKKQGAKVGGNKKPVVSVGAKNKAQLKGLLLKGKAQRQAVVAKKRGMNSGVQAKAGAAAAKAKGQTMRGLAKKGGQAAGGKKPAKPVGPKVANGKPLAFAPGTLQVSINNSGAAKGNGGAQQPISVKRGNISTNARFGKQQGGGKQKRQQQAAQGVKQGRLQKVAAKRGNGGPGAAKAQPKARVTVGGARF